jgi:uncharacterized protein (UPF0303 family)
VKTTGGFRSKQLLEEEKLFWLKSLDIFSALSIGDIAKSIGFSRNIPIAIEVRIGDWTVYHASLPGSSPENDSWIARKARVVNLKNHSTLYERVKAEELSIDWFTENNLSEKEYAIHGGGLPLISKEQGFVGSLIISGLPQIDDHLFGIEVLTEYLARMGESI